MKPKISLITVTRNCKSTIVDSLNSIFDQDYPNLETIWIDGCSTDGTLAILQQYHKKYASGILISESDSGLYDAINKGLNLATGDIIGILHADDTFFDKSILNKISYAFTSRQCNVVYGDLIYVKKNNMNIIVRNWKSSNFSKRKLSYGWMPPHPTIYINRSIFERIGFFNTSYRISSDYDYIVRLFSDPNLKYVYIPQTLIRMRLGGASNKSVSNILIKSKEDLDIIRSHNLGGYLNLISKNIIKLNQLVFPKYKFRNKDLNENSSANINN